MQYNRKGTVLSSMTLLFVFKRSVGFLLAVMICTIVAITNKWKLNTARYPPQGVFIFQSHK